MLWEVRSPIDWESKIKLFDDGDGTHDPMTLALPTGHANRDIVVRAMIIDYENRRNHVDVHVIKVRGEGKSDPDPPRPNPTPDDGTNPQPTPDDTTPKPVVDVAGSFLLKIYETESDNCLLYTSPSPRDQRGSRMPSSA